MGILHRSHSPRPAILESAAAGLLHFPDPPALESAPAVRPVERTRRRRRPHRTDALVHDRESP